MVSSIISAHTKAVGYAVMRDGQLYSCNWDTWKVGRQLMVGKVMDGN